MQEMNPVKWAIRPLGRYADFKGRSPRAEYWWFTLITCSFSIPLDLFDRATGMGDAIGTIVNLALFLPSLAVTVRRLHDTNRSGRWLSGLLAGVFIVAAVSAVIPGSATLIIAGLLCVAAGATLFCFLVLPGSQGPNDYGADPYGTDEQLEEVFA